MILVWLARTVRHVRNRRTLAIPIVGAILLGAILGNATTFYVFDGARNPEISFADAIWYSLISVTTIGYGDFSAVSTPARIGTAFFIIGIGLSTFTVFFGFVIDSITELTRRGERGMVQIRAANHVLIVNFPGAGRVRQIIEEVRLEGETREIVVVTDRLQELPFSLSDVHFVRGSPLSQETYRRAAVEHAKMAIVLAPSYTEAESDAVVASAVSVIDSLKPEIHIVAECEDHPNLFASVRCDAIVMGHRISGSLLAQEAHDPGVARAIEAITSNRVADGLHSVVVRGELPTHSYIELAKQWYERDVNLLSVIRGSETFTTFTGLQPAEGDRVVYMARNTHRWSDLAHV